MLLEFLEKINLELTDMAIDLEVDTSEFDTVSDIRWRIDDLLDSIKAGTITADQFAEDMKEELGGLTADQFAFVYGMFIGAVALLRVDSVDSTVANRLKETYLSIKNIVEEGKAA